MSIEDQPPPVATDGPAIWPMVIEDLETGPWRGALAARVVADARERDTLGRQRYGTPLQAGNGRDALVDAYQEALDLLVYIKQAMVEGRLLGDMLYRDAIDMVITLRSVLR